MAAFTPMDPATDPPSPADTSLATSIFSSHHSKASSEADRASKWRFSTLCANVESKDQYGASSTPIYQTATFKGMNGEYDYTRSGNPTRGALGQSPFPGSYKREITDLAQRHTWQGCMVPTGPLQSLPV